ncbi:MAG: hypothetical protein IJN68_01575 [Clostridia bacterium]|nr:hypothetical protein [Clostridia bacterium]
MKKNLKKLFASVLSLALVFLLSLSAFAADVGDAEAKSIALKDAGYAQADVLWLSAYPDYDDGVKHYDVEFYVENADGSFFEYSYEVSADGRIREKDVEREGYRVPSGGQSVSKPANQAASQVSPAAADADVGLEAAKKAAVAYFGLNYSEVEFIKAVRERDDGRYVYDIEFCKDYDAKYSCDVLAADGRVIDADKDVSRDIFDKLELFFELLFARLFSR